MRFRLNRIGLIHRNTSTQKCGKAAGELREKFSFLLVIYEVDKTYKTDQEDEMERKHKIDSMM